MNILTVVDREPGVGATNIVCIEQMVKTHPLGATGSARGLGEAPVRSSRVTLGCLAKKAFLPSIGMSLPECELRVSRPSGAGLRQPVHL